MRDAEQYPAYSTDEAASEPAVWYDQDEFPDVQQALDLLNEIALLDEQTACIQYPSGSPEQHQAAIEALQAQAERMADHGLEVVSFDIDLTLATGQDDEDEITLIDPAVITRMQQMGYVVGTCSDRGPNNQWETMATLGQQPHFCIPKEMLGWTKVLVPGNSHLHVGDDQRRDRDIAERSGWTHQWPDEFNET